jgi:hypothetical protein
LERFVDTAGSGHGLGAPENIEDTGQPTRARPFFHRFTRATGARFNQFKTFVAGLMIGLSIWTPLFVATAADEADWQQFGLPGGLAMFGAGVWLRMGRVSLRGRRSPPHGPAGPSHSGMGGLVV